MSDGQQLTARQLEIVKLVSQGHNRESIGAQLGISRNTVGRHMDEIYHRLQVNSLLEMVLKLYDLKEKADGAS